MNIPSFQNIPFCILSYENFNVFITFNNLKIEPVSYVIFQFRKNSTFCIHFSIIASPCPNGEVLKWLDPTHKITYSSSSRLYSDVLSFYLMVNSQSAARNAHTNDYMAYARRQPAHKHIFNSIQISIYIRHCWTVRKSDMREQELAA